jgi:hypothetical protein
MVDSHLRTFLMLLTRYFIFAQTTAGLRPAGGNRSANQVHVQASRQESRRTEGQVDLQQSREGRREGCQALQAETEEQEGQGQEEVARQVQAGRGLRSASPGGHPTYFFITVPLYSRR